MSTLFLDRDGVINVRIVDNYVTRKEDFVLIDGVLEALKIFATKFDRIFMVTNQQGIGKGLMTHEDLRVIHDDFLEKVRGVGGRIDHIYYCPELKSAHSFRRKPAIGMALQAKNDYPEISLKNSVMVGDTMTDMLFGRRAHMTTVLVGDEPEIAQKNPHLVDYRYPTLIDYAKSLTL